MQIGIYDTRAIEKEYKKLNSPDKYDIINIEEGQSASAHIKNKDYECRVSRIEKKTSGRSNIA